jgi:hypothetical protein
MEPEILTSFFAMLQPLITGKGVRLAKDPGVQEQIDRLVEKPRFIFHEGEEPLLFYYNTEGPEGLVHDETDMCVLLTNKRLLQRRDDETIHEVFLEDIEHIEHIRKSRLFWDRLHVYLKNGTMEDFDIVTVEATATFRDAVQAMLAQAVGAVHGVNPARQLPQAAPPTGKATRARLSQAEEIAQWFKLLKDGAITEEEYQARKARLLKP